MLVWLEINCLQTGSSPPVWGKMSKFHFFQAPGQQHLIGDALALVRTRPQVFTKLLLLTALALL